MYPPEVTGRGMVGSRMNARYDGVRAIKSRTKGVRVRHESQVTLATGHTSLIGAFRGGAA